MDKGKLKGHAALWVANLVWGLNAPIGKSVLWSEHNPGGVSPFALSVYRMLGACLLFWSVSLFLPRERVARRDIVLLLFASVFGIQLNQMLCLWWLDVYKRQGQNISEDYTHELLEAVKEYSIATIVISLSLIHI